MQPCATCLSGIINRYFESAFPAGTLGVNLIGCLAVGLLWEPLAQTSLSPHVRTFFLIGVLGAFTTFSTYGIESVNLLRDGEPRLALLNLFLSNVLGIAFVLLGLGISRIASEAI